jgi:hypothetical protein
VKRRVKVPGRPGAAGAPGRLGRVLLLWDLYFSDVKLMSQVVL